jgi:PKD repeat protein
MRNYYILTLAMILCFFSNKVTAQCNPAFQPYINGNQVYFTTNNVDPGIAHIWHMGDGAIGYGNVTSHQYASAGQYQVKHVIRNASGVCYDSAMLMVVITADTCNLNAGIAHHVNTNNHKQVHFYGLPGTPNLKYKWFFGDGTSAFSLNPIHIYQNYGQYIVKLIVQDTITNCVDTAYQNISIIDSCNIQANFTYTTSSTNSHTVTFQSTGNTTSGSVFLWNFGDGAYSNSQNTSHTFNLPGTYTVGLTVWDSLYLCGDSTTKYITITGNSGDTCNLQANYTYTQSSTNSHTVTFQSTGNTTSSSIFLWNFGDGVYSNSQNTSHTFNLPGTYTVGLTVWDSLYLCRDSITQYVIISNNPIDSCNIHANFTYTVNPTNSFSVSFQATSNTPNNAKYRWYFGDGYFSYSQNATHTYTQTGTYAVGLTVWDSLYLCRDSTTQYITISGNASDSCTANFTYTIANGAMASFIAQSNQTIVNVSWQILNPRDSSLSQYSNLINPTVHLGDTGVYYVCVTITTNTGCIKTYCSNIYNSISGREMPTNVKLFPNPVINQLNVEFSATQSGSGSYKVINVMGNLVSEKQISFIKGNNKISIPVQQLHTGQYILTLQLGKESKKSNFLKL